MKLLKLGKPRCFSMKTGKEMTQARCFNCNIGLPDSGKSMEELLDLNLPLFCCTECAIEKMDKLRVKVKNNTLSLGSETGDKR